MSTKRKKKVDIKNIIKNDETMIALKERYFKLMKQEKIGKTSGITATLDRIEVTIKKRIEELTNEN